MIALFLNSLAEYINDLEQQITEQQITDLHRIIHKLKPSVLSLEVRGAKNELAIIDDATGWTPQVQGSVERLLQTFKTIQPMMQEDLEEMKDE